MQVGHLQKCRMRTIRMLNQAFLKVLSLLVAVPNMAWGFEGWSTKHFPFIPWCLFSPEQSKGKVGGTMLKISLNIIVCALFSVTEVTVWNLLLAQTLTFWASPALRARYRSILCDFPALRAQNVAGHARVDSCSVTTDQIFLKTGPIFQKNGT